MSRIARTLLLVNVVLVVGGNVVQDRTVAYLDAEIDALEKRLDMMSEELEEKTPRVSVHVHSGHEHRHSHAGSEVHIYMHEDGGHHDGHDHMDNDCDHDYNHSHEDHHDDHHDDHHHDEHHHHDHHHEHNETNIHKYHYARCDVAMNPTLEGSPHNLKGSIFFRQKRCQPLEMIYHIKGFNMPVHDHHDNTDELHMHAVHLHQYGDFSNGCESFGFHFNPQGKTHGAKDANNRHAGDWSNIRCDDMGEVHTNTTDTQTAILGTHSIVGRGVVIHEHMDDHGQDGHGHAGARLACCSVVWSAHLDWDKLLKHDH